MNSRLLITFIWSLFATLCTSQTPISNSVEDARNNYRLEHIELFQMIEPMSKPEIPSGVERFGLYDISTSQLGSIMEQKKPFISVNLQLETQNYTLELLEIELLDKDFRVVNAQEEEVDLPRGKHYRGIVNGDPNSMAAVSFFNDEVIGVLILPSEGVFNLGKLENDNEHYVFYPEGAIETQNPFVCGNDESMDVHYEDESPLPVTTGAPCKKVNVYIEADNIMYRDFSSNMTAVTNFITAVWNVSALIYQNEDIILGIKTIKIWNTPDPYRKNEPKNLLDDFSSNVKNNIDGDIGHILTTTNGRLGGLAWVDVLCKSYRSFNNYNRTAMSNINRSYRQFPVYSWTVMVVTHEMGHNLGSHHTHRCVWGPQRNEALDNCEDTEGNCPPGPAPIGGGTIMSYCHLTQYGINFSKGFGDEPGNRIRSRIDNAICLGSAFQTSVDIEGEVQFYEGDSTILKANPVGPQYAYQWYKDDLILPDEDNSEIIVKNSGTYYCEITTSCSEVTEEVTVEVEPFYVSLHCPLQDPVIGSASYTLDTIFIDAEEDIHLIDIPASLANSVPDDVESSSINMEVCVSSYPPSRVLDLNLNYSGPAGSNIEDIEFTEHQNIFYGQECFLLHLGSFDPTGEWTFRVSHSFTDRPNLPESWAAITIFQNWEFAPEPSDCDLNLCEGDTAVLDAGVEGLKYRWSTGASSQKINVYRSGTYAVTVTNGDISRTDDIDVRIIPTQFHIDTTVCEEDGFVLGNRVLTSSGIYTDTFVSTTGCDSIIQLELIVEEAPKTWTRKEVCYGAKVDGQTLTSDTLLIERITRTGQCDSIHETLLSVLPEINLALDANPGCEDEGAVVSAEVTGNRPGIYGFAWDNGAIGSQIDSVKSGEITCTVTDEDQCTSEETILVENYDSVAVQYMTQGVDCFGEATGAIDVEVISGTPDFTFSWSNGSNEADLVNIPAGRYQLEVTDMNGCTESIEVEVDQNSDIEANADVVNVKNNNDGEIHLDPIGGAGNYSYLWSDGSREKSRTGLTVGIYEVTITDQLGCEATFSIQVKMSSSLMDLDGVKGYNLFPNPTDSRVMLSIDLLSEKAIKCELMSPTGETVWQREFGIKRSLNEVLDTRALPGGQYFLRVHVGEQSGVLSLVVHH